MSGRRRPPAHTALAALPALVLDLETTGLDVGRDRVVQIGAVAMSGPRVLEEPRLDLLIDPGVPMPPTAERIHGIADADLAGAPGFAAVAQRLRELLAERVVVGHSIAFDLAVLRHEAARAGIAWYEPVWIDVAMLAGAIEPRLPELGLETLADLLGVTIADRHRALGDALATAAIWARLLERLRDADVRTLGEAQSLAASREDLSRRHAEAGWHATPREALAAAQSPAPPARVDAYVFARRLDEVMGTPPAFVGPQATLRAAAGEMVERRIGALLVGDAVAPPQGILTERDLVRATADAGVDADRTTVASVMSAPVECMARDEMLYRALARMDRLGVRHLGVVDDRGVAVGMLSQRDLLGHRARATTVLDDALARAVDGVGLAACFGRLPAVAEGLLAEGLGGVAVARVVSNEIRELTARAAGLAMERMAQEGLGGAPAPWCLLVLGSAGRGESLLGADQDNAIVHAGTDAHDGWFARLGALVADLLAEAGVPRCAGGVMAANREWRGNVADWERRVGGWIGRARPADLLNVDIFFDLVPVAGDATLARVLHADAVAAASRAPPFVALLAESVASMSPPLGLFGRLRSEGGRVDLKRGALLPLVSLARTLALRAGSAALSTPDRLRAASAAGRLSEGDAITLVEIHAELLTLVARQQVGDLADGVRASSRVALASLGRREAARLRRSLRRLAEMLQVLRGAVSGP